MDRIAEHSRILAQIHETYIQKNRAYGNSFDLSLDEYGEVAALVRMSDKWNRLNSLIRNPDIPVGDESVEDTLLDLANYCIMTVLWARSKNEPVNNIIDEVVEDLKHQIEEIEKENKNEA